MARAVLIAAILALVAGCDAKRPSSAQANGRVGELASANAKLVGYLYTPDQPAVLASFSGGMLRWQSDPHGKTITEGHAEPYTEPGKSCLGFEQKNLFMPSHGQERYLVCEALESIKHRNHLPRSQDFSLKRGDLFLEYQPPTGTGFPQIYYLSVQK